MKFWNDLRARMPRWPREKGPTPPAPTAPASDEDRLARSVDTLRALLEDPQVPAPLRQELAEDFGQVQAMLDKLEYGHLHIAVFGRVGVGKSALLNALLGSRQFSTSPLHGETKKAQLARWQAYDAGGVFLIDTPGINEVGGEERERLAHEVAGRSDLVLFVVEGDISDTELAALRLLLAQHRPLLLVFNKSDRYTRKDRELVLTALRTRTKGLLPPEHIVMAAADPAERVYIQVDETGQESEITRRPEPEMSTLQERLWAVLEKEGKTLVALNASLFAGKLTDTLNLRIVELRRGLADKVVHQYGLAKGLLVGINPVPVSDLLAAVAVDVSLVMHLSRVYGLPLTRHEAGGLIRTISTQMALLMGTVWAVTVLSSALKASTFGISTVLTGATQGAVAYYATYIVGQAAHRYFAQGKSWGERGPKRLVEEILESVDRDSLLAEARGQILARLKAGT